jgi:Pentapeptide repeats (8 copies)
MDSNQLKERYKAGERDFREVSLSGTSLVWFELSGIDLRGADLSCANLSGANLSEANLSEGTNLSFADLSRTDLSNANLKGANLEGANLAGAVLEGAVYNPQTKFPRGFDPARQGAIATGDLPPAILDEPLFSSEGSPLSSETTPPQLELEQYVTTTKPKSRRRDRKEVPSTPPEESHSPQKGTPAQLELELEQHTATTKPQPFHPTVVDELAKQVKSAFNSFKSDWNQASHSDWTVATSSHQAFQPFQVGNTSGLGSSSIVPKEIKGWNWGAFLLPWGWFLTNRVWGGFWIWILCLIPQWGVGITVLYALLSASKGNEWAWKSRKWESIAAFKKHQLFWAIAGFIFWGCMIFAALSKKG